MNWFILTLSVTLSLSSIAKTVIVSDIDDTIRQSNVVNKPNALRRLFATPAAFDGLTYLYTDQQQKSLATDNDFAIAYVSASYPIFYNAKEWVELKGFPKGEYYQRRIHEGKKNFKKSNIKRFLSKNLKEGDTVLLFGDNAELDPEIYKEIKKELKLEDAEIFIRDVRVTVGKYAIVKKPGDKLSGITYFSADVELLNHPRFRETSEINQNMMYTSFNNGSHIPDYMMERVGKGLKHYCKTKNAKANFCEGSSGLLNFINDVDMAILEEQGVFEFNF